MCILGIVITVLYCPVTTHLMDPPIAPLSVNDITNLTPNTSNTSNTNLGLRFCILF